MPKTSIYNDIHDYVYNFWKTFLMKDDVKVRVPNGTPKTLIPLNGVRNWDGVLKYGGWPKGDHATHF
jgi:hypothetical protein